ncbi:MAG TPA: hypothetical protein PKW35_21610, partial [Nannocystaceae bacterium]|nr:hypothetical protein [Nannocystaceae bacterium]
MESTALCAHHDEDRSGLSGYDVRVDGRCGRSSARLGVPVEGPERGGSIEVEDARPSAADVEGAGGVEAAAAVLEDPGARGR